METKNEKRFSANDLTPAYPVHPGEVLSEELKSRGISQKSFAEAVGIQATHLSALIHGVRNFTPAVAEKIASGLEGISADFWTKMQESYNIDVQRKKIRPSSLVSGYQPIAGYDIQPALAQPQASYGSTLQVILTIPASDKDLLDVLAARFGWKYEKNID